MSKPYKLAVLKDRKGDITKRWYIEFYVWNEATKTLERVMDYKNINAYKTVKERKEYAKERIKVINELLVKGYYRNAPAPSTGTAPAPDPVALAPDGQEPEKSYTVKEAFELVRITKSKALRLKSAESYSLLNNQFFKFAESKKMLSVDITALQKKHIILFIDFLLHSNKYSNQTINNKLQILKAVFNTLIERGILKDNICKGIKNLPTDIGKNRAFTEAEIKVLLVEVKKEPLQLYTMVMMIYYTFIRPGELLKLKLKWIDLKNRQVFVPAEISKNRKDGFVKIPTPLLDHLLALELHQYGPEYFLLSPAKKPGLKRYNTPQLSRAFGRILKKAGFDENYSLYSFKHTGVIGAYKAGVTLKTIQHQCRHSNLEMTDIYLKSLGLSENKELEEKSW